MPMFNLVPIRTAEDHRQALLRVQALLHAEPGTKEFDELEILTDLCTAYESRHHAVPKVTGRDALQHLMEAHGLSRKSFAAIMSRTSMSRVLSGRRDFTLRQVKALAKRFNVPASIFIN